MFCSLLLRAGGTVSFWFMFLFVFMRENGLTVLLFPIGGPANDIKASASHCDTSSREDSSSRVPSMIATES